jgi:large subunit ribosomal protein LX
MKPFRVSGQFRMGHIVTPFSTETVADDAAGAKDRVLSTIGSRHRVDRHHVTVKDVVELKPADVTDPAIVKRLSMVK